MYGKNTYGFYKNITGMVFAFGGKKVLAVSALDALLIFILYQLLLHLSSSETCFSARSTESGSGAQKPLADSFK